MTKPEPAHTNRLAREKSPYLLQHAHNPVAWYPWGEEAFARARQEGKPIFLSIGYSTCHWCHVMERESFENEEIARILNEHFVAIKVDREERPDLDKVYMTYVQAATGAGGWPMSVWLTPELKPFLGGTYYPPEDRWGRPGFKSILLSIAEAWQNDRGQILAAASNATQQLQRLAAGPSGQGPALESSLLEAGYQQIKASYEERYGGFSLAPKFPRPVVLNFLLRYSARALRQGSPLRAEASAFAKASADTVAGQAGQALRQGSGQAGASDALSMSLFTLRKMAEGGMHDQLGGGFHRYSVDNFWHVPHFEKMLYDQAQLVCSYLEAYQITHEPFYAKITRDILEYVRRDLTGPDGQFYSAEDADSPVPGNPAEHSEGAFYLWQEHEIVTALGGQAAAIFNFYYGVEPDGNSDPQGEFRGKNILIVRHTLEETAGKFGRQADEIGKLLAAARATLLETRSRRPRPSRDDKTITAWNGLMISAFARAYQVLEEPICLEAAGKAATFIEATLYDRQTGRLLRRYRDGQAAIDGFVDDYAFLIQGLLDLYEASFEIKWLTWALALQQKQDALFWDDTGGGYFGSAGEEKSVILRLKDDYDGAEPSPNSVAVLNLLRLAQMTDNQELRARGARTMQVFSAQLQRLPHAMPQMLSAFDFYSNPPRQIIIAGRAAAPDTRALLREVHRRFIPNKIILLADGAAGQETLGKHLEFIRSVRMLDGKATAYVCQNYVCQLPATDVPTLSGLLQK